MSEQQTISRNWRPQDISKLRREYGTKSTSLLAQEMNRTGWAVQSRARLMGLRKQKVVMRQKHLEMVMALYTRHTAKEIAGMLGVTESCIRMCIREARHGYEARKRYA